MLFSTIQLLFNEREYLQFSTWRQKRCKIVEDLRIYFSSCKTHNGANIKRKGPQLLP